MDWERKSAEAVDLSMGKVAGTALERSRWAVLSGGSVGTLRDWDFMAARGVSGSNPAGNPSPGWEYQGSWKGGIGAGVAIGWRGR